jgi:hypothetical protein
MEALVTAHHTEKMFLLTNVQCGVASGWPDASPPRANKSAPSESEQGDHGPLDDSKTHGFALSISPLTEDREHEIRSITGQEEYVSRERERES